MFSTLRIASCRTIRAARRVYLVVTSRYESTQRLPFLIDTNHVIRSPLSDVIIPDMSLTDYVLKDVDKWKDNPVLTDAISGCSYTFGEARDAIERLTISLPDATGLKSGETLGIIMPNSPEFAFTILSAAAAGLVISPANPAYTVEELSRQMSDAGVRAMVTIPTLLEKTREAMELMPGGGGQLVVATDGSGAQEAALPSDVLSLHKLLAREYTHRTPRLSRPDPDQLVALPYSSGTTGLPKGVRLTHRNLVANLCQVTHPDVFPFKNRYGKQNVAMGILPFYHIYGLNGLLNASICLGRHIITMPRFEPTLFATAFARYKPTVLSVVPPLLLFLASTDLIAREDLDNLHYLMTGAAPATRTLIEKFMQKVNADICEFREGYGMTETSCVATITPNRRYGPCKLGSCGVPVSLSEIKIVDEDGNALPQGQEGELWIRGPHIMQGYHNNEAATREILTEDRWLKTGDVACVDEEGHLYIVDRKKELIKVKGLQVSPTELENVLRKMDGIADLAIIGVPDERAGELPRAFVVRAPNSNIKESDVEHFLETRVAPFKKLSGGVKFINEIPKTPSGKILRKTLREIK